MVGIHRSSTTNMVGIRRSSTSHIFSSFPKVLLVLFVLVVIGFLNSKQMMESTLINNSVQGHNNDKDKVVVKKKHLSSLLSFLHPGGQGKEELSKVAFTTRAEKCTDTKFLPPLDFTADVFKGQLMSQDHEDETLLDNFFGGLCSGTYLEMGGLDGVTFSNTHVFNKVLGWNGVLVELGPKNFAALQKNRPNEIANVNAGVCDKKKTLHYVEYEAVGGIWEFSSQSFRDQWWPNVKLEDTPSIKCEPLKDILENHAPNTTYFDFFSLDIEGAEFEALLSLDYSKVGFGIIFVEADGHNKRKDNALRTFLEQRGYTFLWSKDRSDWFINKDFASIYEDRIH